MGVGHGACDIDHRQDVGEAGRCDDVVEARETALPGFFDPIGLPGGGIVVPFPDAERGLPAAVAAIKGEGLPGRLEALVHQARRDANAMARGVYTRPGFAEETQHLLVRDLDPRALEDTPRGPVDPADSFFLENRQSQGFLFVVR